MKKSSVLIRRAALFTATVMAVTVAVSLCGYIAGMWIQLRQIAKQQLRPQVEHLAEVAGGALSDPASDADPVGAVSAGLMREADMLKATDQYVWFVSQDDDAQPTGVGVGTDMAFPAVRHGLSGTQYGTQRIDGRLYVYAQHSLPESFEYPWIGVSIPVRGLPLGLICAAISALLGILLGLLTGRLLLERMLRPAVAPVARLRDAAVAMAEGDLETRADEKVEGELGELGKALNHLSDQLSRNMYTLIVERNRLRNMLNGLSEGIVAINAEKRVTHTNPALGKLIPRPKAGQHFPDPRMKTIPDESIWADFDQVMETGDSMTRNLESLDMTLRMTVTPIRDELDAIAGAVGLFSDITQMERLEKTRRDYVSNVSHELRTPLTAMRALVEPLKDGMVTNEEDRQRYYDIILREIMRLSRLINDQLELSRLQSGTLSIQKTQMKIDDLVYDVCDRYEAIAEEHGLKLKVITDFSQCPSVYANADRLEQMLIILLDNAIKYTEEGSVSLSARWDDEKVVISVKDTGIGIDAQDLPYVFDRFYKVDKAHSGKGSGLGLSIAKELLKRMGEDIRVASEKGKGTQFSFTVHRNPPPAEPEIDEPEPLTDTGKQRALKRRKKVK
ncbi:MAG: HAMP domain-containing protein [Clostridia bacterium]|nr:HAMP domain-containing protein [Clostridia bacterium]